MMGSVVLFKRVLLIALVGVSVLMSFGTVLSAPFQEGERLEYNIEWLGMRVGMGRMEIESMEHYKDREVYRIVSMAKSNDFLSFFFPVEDRVESLMDSRDYSSYKLQIRQRHGPRRVKKDIAFDQEENLATMIYKRKERTFEIPPRVKDSLSSLYYFRALSEYPIGESIFIDVHASKKNWKLEIEILRRETLSIPLGTFETIVVMAKVRYDGILMDKGDVYVWLTDDDRHIPIQFKADIALGSIKATLSSLALPDLTAFPSNN